MLVKASKALDASDRVRSVSKEGAKPLASYYSTLTPSIFYRHSHNYFSSARRILYFLLLSSTNNYYQALH